ncbi:MAG: gamma-glutamyltransferase [Hydrococcus sp. Prado102]|jgi:gamma-glutamyltranspeptidase/glutathione hydrolase|nr:gamma-glutamyltransferase [Hydrococcus sp. Prado102]
MNLRKLCKKIFLILLTSSGIFFLFIALDIIIAGSIYHPLTYVYQILSWLSCKTYFCPDNSASSTAVSAKNGMIVTTQHEASQVGIKILLAGGNAIDAAVAVGYALAVTDPCCGNLGGGGFMLIHLADGKEIFIDFREKAPLAANRNMYLDKEGKVIDGLSTKGYLAVGVPGTVKGLDFALSKYGTLSRQQVINPALALAEKGFILQAGDIRILQANRDKFQDANIANIFLKNGKDSYEVGDRLIQKDLARTLKSIATQGTDIFYKGAIAHKIINASQANGGILSLKDFANYSVVNREPIRCNYRGYEIVSSPPPGGGITVCQMLNILEGYNLKGLGFHSVDSLDLMFSAMLYAYRDRNIYLGDPAFVKIPMDKLLSERYAARIRGNINRDRNNIEQNYSKEGTNTTHYSVVDRYGNAVAVTYTINSNFGAGVIASDTGFFLNNEMDDFTSKPGVANQFGLVQGEANLIEPGKRPLSSMSPTIVTKDGKVFLVTGSPGGSTIPTTVVQVITNIIDYGMTVDRAVNSPRIHYQGSPNFVLSEPYALNSKTVQKLWEKGYKVVPFLTWGAAESIQVNLKDNSFLGASDRRKSAGKASGF